MVVWVGRCWAFASVLCSSLLQYNVTASVGDVVAENLLLLKETWSNYVTEVEDFSFGEIFFSDQWSILSRWVCYSPLTFEVPEHCYDSKLAVPVLGWAVAAGGQTQPGCLYPSAWAART